jgi:hypothetical protein
VKVLQPSYYYLYAEVFVLFPYPINILWIYINIRILTSSLLLNTPFYTSNVFTNSPILIERDSEKEYMDIDYRNLEKDKVYLINYQGETYAVAKKSEDEIAFYDVIKS